jgi:Tol biopolymer transport system component
MRRVTLSGESTPLSWAGPSAGRPAFSRQGRRFAFTRGFRDTNLWLLPLAPDGVPKPIAVSSAREVAPRFSPDGQRLAFHSFRSGPAQIWVTKADGSDPLPLTQMPKEAMTGTPRWSPDGRQLVFDSSASGLLQLYYVSPQGGPATTPRQGKANNYCGIWSPDGQWIYYASNRNPNETHLWRLPAKGGGEPEKVAADEGECPDFSPDGQWLYYVKRAGTGGLWRRPIAGGAEEKLAPAVYRNNFVVTAEGVYYCLSPPGTRNLGTIRYLDLKTRQEREIHKFTKPVDLGLALAPDGKHLLFSQVDSSGVDLMWVEGFQ